MECICLVLPPCLRPSQKGELVGFSLVSANTIFRGLVIEVAAISLCSGLTVCLPPRSFLPLQVKTHRAAEAFLCPSRTCVVTFARIGYAIRPTTGNWRNEDFHLARFAALSAAHSSSKLFRTRQPEFSRAKRTTRSSISGLVRGRPGDRRFLQPSNFSATSRRYQARMVSGLASRATGCRPLRPKRLPISARGGPLAIGEPPAWLQTRL